MGQQHAACYLNCLFTRAYISSPSMTLKRFLCHLDCQFAPLFYPHRRPGKVLSRVSCSTATSFWKPFAILWRLKYLLRMAEPDLNPDAIDALLRRQFMRGLPPPLRLKLLESDPTPDLATISSNVLNCLNSILPGSHDKQKLVAQCYDGASVMIGQHRGVQSIVKDAYPNAHYVHCYAHQLNLILQQAVSQITSIRVFFANLKAFSVFFPLALLREYHALVIV